MRHPMTGAPHGRVVRDLDRRVLRGDGAGREGGRAAVSVENLAGLVVSVVVLGYLVVALLFPERF